jgi:hypothetical protein
MMFADGFEVETESSDGGSANRCLILEIAHIYSGNVKHLPRKIPWIPKLFKKTDAENISCKITYLSFSSAFDVSGRVSFSFRSA